jgi:protein-L-isoaspartate(D-aspartate) O-methyltransferase
MDYSRVFLLIVVGVLGIVFGCGNGNQTMDQRNEHSRQDERDWMVDTQIVRGGITDSKVVAAMRRVPRHHFIPEYESEDAYGDFPLPIGHSQTISQPYIVAYMTDALKLQPGEKVLEIGTGSGYQAAILAELGVQVYTIEIVKPLAQYARENLSKFRAVSGRRTAHSSGWGLFAKPGLNSTNRRGLPENRIVAGKICSDDGGSRESPPQPINLTCSSKTWSASYL